MSRPLRIEYENAFYHVMNRGRGREKIFLNDNDFEYFLHSIEQAFALILKCIHIV